jgi:hypothetical protein
MEPDEPPRKNYGFKKREFKRDNAPGAAVPTAKELAILSGQRAPAAPKPGLSAMGPAKADDPNDVYAVLQQNRAVEKKLGLGDVEIKKVKSRRKRDYWLLVIPSNLLLAIITWQMRGNPFVLVLGIAGIVLVTLGLTWVMWHIMEDY